MLARKMANSSPVRDYKQSKEKYLSKLDHLVVNSKYDIIEIIVLTLDA